MANKAFAFLKKHLSLLAFLIGVPAVIAIGILLFRNERYQVISVCIAFLSCVPFFVRFEKGKSRARELVVIAVMTALSVVGRLIFSPLPGFKPVSAMVLITGIAFGPEAGFVTGSMTAIVSNLFFGQGPWTPFQMFLWGLLGFLTGLILKRGKNPGKIRLILCGLLGGVLFSTGMDIWTTLSTEGAFSWQRYLFYVLASLPEMLKYAISNVIFLLLFTKPMLAKTERLRIKYGIFETDDEM